MSGNAYEDFVAGFLDQAKRTLPTPEAEPFSGTFPPFHRDLDKPLAAILPPHPDDECLTGALPLRLMREAGWQVLNIAMTFGSDAARCMDRKQELAAACAQLGFACTSPEPNGLTGVSLKDRERDPAAWANTVAKLSALLDRYNPDLILMPHAQDWNERHIGTHALGMDAVAKLGNHRAFHIAYTEYWQSNSEANTLIGLSTQDAALLLKALCCHVGEVQRNPYNTRFPAFLMDNIRRGSEVVASKGATAAPFDLGMCYRVGVWKDGAFHPREPRIIGPQDDITKALT